MARRTGHSELVFLFAPGAGAPSSSDWMQSFARRLADLGHVECFDYPYQREGRRSPDRLPKLVEAHAAAFANLRANHGGSLVLAGKSMGSRVGCHLANQLGERGPAALVCFGYPLVGQNGTVRDAVLLELRAPILFVQGSRDALCPLDRLDSVRKGMQAPSELHVVDGGDHSLKVGARALAQLGRSQVQIDEAIFRTVQDFTNSFLQP